MFVEGLKVSVKKEMINAGLLYEMQDQKGNEGYEVHNYEEWQASYPGNMPYMWYKDV